MSTQEKQIIYRQEPMLALKVALGVWIGFFLIVFSIVIFAQVKPGVIGSGVIAFTRDCAIAVKAEMESNQIDNQEFEANTIKEQ
jgi:hypothetical protein